VSLEQRLKDFPAAMLEEYEVEAQPPDEFIAHLIDLNPAWVLAAVERHRASLKSPPKSRDDYLDTLLQQGLPETVSQLRQRAIAF
jgi:hypothetical protein